MAINEAAFFYPSDLVNTKTTVKSGGYIPRRFASRYIYPPIFAFPSGDSCVFYMANPVLGKSLCSDWFFLGQDFALRTVSTETVQPVYFCFEARPANWPE